MASSVLISKGFYTQLITIGSIGLCSILGFRFMTNENKTAIKEEIAPLVQRVMDAEKKIEKLETLLAVNTLRTDATYLSANVFIDNYNRAYHRYFLRPVDVETETEYKRRK